jgi:hypothetical protein
MVLAIVSLVVLTAILIALVYMLESDRVELSNTSGSENGILVNAQGTAGALSYQRFTSLNTTIDVGRLQASTGNDEVIAFNSLRPVAMTSPVTWTSHRDTVAVSFPDQIKIAVTMWILQGPFAAQSTRLSQNCIDTVAAWDAERMGVAFAPGGCADIRDATNPSVASKFLDFQCGFSGNEIKDDLQAKIGKTPDRINIYVVDTVDAAGDISNGNGTSCGTVDFIALGSQTISTVLTHEFGHTFSLTHVDRVADFDDTNYMYSYSSNRQYFTEGQLFRAHFAPSAGKAPPSALNEVYHAHSGPGRDCPFNVTSDHCPALDKRIWSDGTYPPN